MKKAIMLSQIHTKKILQNPHMLGIYLKIYFIFNWMCVSVCTCLCVSVCVCACAHVYTHGIRSPQDGVKSHSEPTTRRCWEPSYHPIEEQQVFVMADPSLQLHILCI